MSKQVEMGEVISVEPGGKKGKVQLPGRQNTCTVAFTKPVAKGDLMPIAKIHRDPQQRIGLSLKEKSRQIGSSPLAVSLTGIWPALYCNPERDGCSIHSQALDLSVENDWISSALTFTYPAKFEDRWEFQKGYNGKYTARIMKDSTDKEFIYVYNAWYGNIFKIDVASKSVVWKHVVDGSKIPPGATTGDYDAWFNLARYDAMVMDSQYIYVFVDRIDYLKHPAFQYGEPGEELWYPGVESHQDDYYAQIVAAYSYFYILDHSGRYVGCSYILRQEIKGYGNYLPDPGGLGNMVEWGWPDLDHPGNYFYTIPETTWGDLPYTQAYLQGFGIWYYNWDHVKDPWGYYLTEDPGPIPWEPTGITGNVDSAAGTYVKDPWRSSSRYSLPVLSTYNGKSYICLNRNGCTLSSDLPGEVAQDREQTRINWADNNVAVKSTTISEAIIIDCSKITTADGIRKITEATPVLIGTEDHGFLPGDWHIIRNSYACPLLGDPASLTTTLHPAGIQDADIWANAPSTIHLGDNDFCQGITLRKKSDGSSLSFSMYGWTTFRLRRMVLWNPPGEAITEGTRQIVMMGFDFVFDETQEFAGIAYINTAGSEFWGTLGHGSCIIPFAPNCTLMYFNNLCANYGFTDGNGKYMPCGYWIWTLGRQVYNEETEENEMRYWQSIEKYNWNASASEHKGYLLTPIEGVLDLPDAWDNLITENNRIIITRGTEIKIFSNDLALLKDTTLPFSPLNHISIGAERLYTLVSSLVSSNVKGIK